MNNHKYAKILKDSNSSFYKVIITNTYETGGLFGGIKEHKEEYEIPFVFKTSEIAKDFVSMLPDSIEEFNIKMHRCEHCHLCYASYKTYKLTIGDFTIYVQWDEVEQEEKGFLTDKVFINSKNNVVKNFVDYIRPYTYQGGVYTGSNRSDFLTDIVKMLKKAKSEKDALREEYNFELVQQ